MIDISFRNYLQTLTLLPIEQGKVDETLPSARVWFQRANANTLILNNGTPYLDDATFDAEVMSLNIDQTQTEAGNIRTALHGFRGLMFPDTVAGVFVSDVADDYTPKNMSADVGFHLQAFTVRIIS